MDDLIERMAQRVEDSILQRVGQINEETRISTALAVQNLQQTVNQLSDAFRHIFNY